MTKEKTEKEISKLLVWRFSVDYNFGSRVGVACVSCIFCDWRAKVNQEYSKILDNLQTAPRKSIMPEAQRLKQIKYEIRAQFRIEEHTAEEIIFNTFNECLNMLAGNFSSYKAYMQSAFGKEAIRDVRIEDINRGFIEGKSSRGLGIDVNPLRAEANGGKTSLLNMYSLAILHSLVKKGLLEKFGKTKTSYYKLASQKSTIKSY